MMVQTIRKSLGKFILLTLLFVPTIAFADVTIDAAHFPDANFRTWLGAQPYGTDGLITDAEIDSIASIDVYDKGIANLAGIENFTALTTLDCGLNRLTALPALPSGLAYLYCSNNELTALPSLPSGLTFLSCWGNELTMLPSLPSSLTVLDCEQNQLTTLPSLPSGLTYLSCGNNPLAALPSLPDGLTLLSCWDNGLTALPPLPDGLTHLYCADNQLAMLPSLPDSLTHLYCADNQLTALPVLPNGLLDLFCRSNQLAALDLSNLSSLTYFDGSSQTILLTLLSDDGNYYSAEIQLNNPRRLASGLTYLNGTLRSSSRSILHSPFRVETGSTGRYLEGDFSFTYRTLSGIPPTGDLFPLELLTGLLVMLAGSAFFLLRRRHSYSKGYDSKNDLL